jgi:predicted nicotinamide N-methyase
LVDADSRVFPYVDCHTQLNAVSASTRTATLGDLVAADFAEQDVVLGADICFWPELATELRKAIEVALAAGVKQVIIADPGRSHFMQMADYFRAHHFAQLLPWQITGRSRKDGYMLMIDNRRLTAPSAA